MIILTVQQKILPKQAPLQVPFKYFPNQPPSWSGRSQDGEVRRLIELKGSHNKPLEMNAGHCGSTLIERTRYLLRNPAGDSILTELGKNTQALQHLAIERLHTATVVFGGSEIPQHNDIVDQGLIAYQKREELFLMFSSSQESPCNQKLPSPPQDSYMFNYSLILSSMVEPLYLALLYKKVSPSGSAIANQRLPNILRYLLSTTNGVDNVPITKLDLKGEIVYEESEGRLTEVGDTETVCKHDTVTDVSEDIKIYRKAFEIQDITDYETLRILQELIDNNEVEQFLFYMRNYGSALEKILLDQNKTSLQIAEEYEEHLRTGADLPNPFIGKLCNLIKKSPVAIVKIASALEQLDLLQNIIQANKISGNGPTPNQLLINLKELKEQARKLLNKSLSGQTAGLVTTPYVPPTATPAPTTNVILTPSGEHVEHNPPHGLVEQSGLTATQLSPQPFPAVGITADLSDPETMCQLLNMEVLGILQRAYIEESNQIKQLQEQMDEVRRIAEETERERRLQEEKTEQAMKDAKLAMEQAEVARKAHQTAEQKRKDVEKKVRTTRRNIVIGGGVGGFIFLILSALGWHEYDKGKEATAEANKKIREKEAEELRRKQLEEARKAEEARRLEEEREKLLGEIEEKIEECEKLNLSQGEIRAKAESDLAKIIHDNDPDTQNGIYPRVHNFNKIMHMAAIYLEQIPSRELTGQSCKYFFKDLDKNKEENPHNAQYYDDIAEWTRQYINERITAKDLACKLANIPPSITDTMKLPIALFNLQMLGQLYNGTIPNYLPLGNDEISDILRNLIDEKKWIERDVNKDPLKSGVHENIGLSINFPKQGTGIFVEFLTLFNPARQTLLSSDPVQRKIIEDLSMLFSTVRQAKGRLLANDSFEENKRKILNFKEFNKTDSIENLKFKLGELERLQDELMKRRNNLLACERTEVVLRFFIERSKNRIKELNDNRLPQWASDKLFSVRF